MFKYMTDMERCEMREPEEQVCKSINDVGKMKLQAGWWKQKSLWPLAS